MIPALETIIQGVATTLRGAGGIGVVNTYRAGESTWANAPVVGQGYWIVTGAGSEAVRSGVGGSSPGRAINKRERVVEINAWYPLDEESNSADEFRGMMDTVETYLATHRQLGVCAKMQGMPTVPLWKIEPYTSPNMNDYPRMCHHARIMFTVLAFAPVTGE